MLTALTITACGRVGFDAVSSDAAPSDVASLTGCNGPPRCPTFAPLCDSFEGAAIAAATWSLVENNGTVEVDGARACRGSQSLHSQTLAIAGGTEVAAITTTSFPFARTTLFVRMYAYVPSASDPASASQVYDLIQVENDTGAEYGVTLDDANGAVEFQNYEPTDVTVTSSLSFPLDRWTCIEWEIDFPTSDGAADGATRITIDGVQAPSIDPAGGLSFSPSSAPINYVELALGAYDSPVALPAAEIWIDDFDVANQPIGCDD
ncbi:MAG TPA: hypothetical protein VMJ10_24815 [Kofleriaceae bacterium]|nr:hypothetical protein [Kofleriaceae bacterium]